MKDVQERVEQRSAANDRALRQNRAAVISLAIGLLVGYLGRGLSRSESVEALPAGVHAIIRYGGQLYSLSFPSQDMKQFEANPAFQKALSDARRATNLSATVIAFAHLSDQGSRAWLLPSAVSVPVLIGALPSEVGSESFLCTANDSSVWVVSLTARKVWRLTSNTKAWLEVHQWYDIPWPLLRATRSFYALPNGDLAFLALDKTLSLVRHKGGLDSLSGVTGLICAGPEAYAIQLGGKDIVLRPVAGGNLPGVVRLSIPYRLRAWQLRGQLYLAGGGRFLFARFVRGSLSGGQSTLVSWDLWAPGAAAREDKLPSELWQLVGVVDAQDSRPN